MKILGKDCKKIQSFLFCKGFLIYRFMVKCAPNSFMTRVWSGTGPDRQIEIRSTIQRMKFVKALVIIAFVAAVGVFSLAQFREWRGRDTSVPEITSDREVLEVTCDYTEEQLLEGLQAYDEKDGDLTGEILVGDISRFIEKGVCNVTYVVFDSSNQPASLVRQIRLTDYHSPRFALSEPLVFEAGTGSYTDTVSKISASDLLDGDLTQWIHQTDTDVNYQIAGTYHMTMEVTNSFGDTASVAFPVHVVQENPEGLDIRLTAPILYVSQGEAVDPAQWLEGVYDSEGEALGTEIVTTTSDLDVQTPGCYEIAYYADDGAGHTGENWLTVVVQG